MGDAIDRLEVKLSKTVRVPRHNRRNPITGKIEDVETYTYERRGKSGIGNSLKGLYHKVVGEGAAGRAAREAAYGAKLREADRRERTQVPSVGEPKRTVPADWKKPENLPEGFKKAKPNPLSKAEVDSTQWDAPGDEYKEYGQINDPYLPPDDDIEAWNKLRALKNDPAHAARVAKAKAKGYL